MLKPHGSMTFSVHGKIMEIEGTGPWNLILLQQGAMKAKPIHQQLLGAPWAVLATFHGDTFYTEEAANVLIEWLKDDKQRGRIATAFVLSDIDICDVAVWHLKKTYREGHETVQFFTHRTDALKWLEQKIAKPKTA